MPQSQYYITGVFRTYKMWNSGMSNQYIEQDSKSNRYVDKLTDEKILKLELFRPHL